MMTEEQKQFAHSLLNQTKTYDEWLAVMRFGLPTLLQDQGVLIGAIMTQAENMANSMPAPINVLMDNTVKICADLEIKFTVDGAEPQ